MSSIDSRAVTRLSLSLALIVVVAAGAGCAAPAAYLTAPQNDAALQNDGSSEAQKALREKYQLVTLEAGWFEDAGLRNAGSTDRVVLSDRNVVRVLSTSPEAAEAIDDWSFGMQSLGSLEKTSFLIAGALTGLSLGYFLGGGFNITTTDDATIVDLSNMTGGAITGTLAAASLLYAADVLSAGSAQISLERAVNAYNRDIDARIAAGAQPTTTTTSSSASSSASTPATPTAPPEPLPPTTTTP